MPNEMAVVYTDMQLPILQRRLRKSSNRVEQGC